MRAVNRIESVVALAACAFGMTLPCGGADAPALGPRLTGWTYHTSARPLSKKYADPGGRLTDGKTGRAETVIWRAGTLNLDLDLKSTCTLQTIRIHQFRHNLNYKLDHLTVSARIAGMWKEIGRIRGFVGPTPTMSFVHTLDLKGVSTDALRLRFAGVGVLSLSEVELFGAKTVAKTVAMGAFADVPLAAGPGATVREGDLDGDGQPEVVLENAFVRLIITPAKGGVCRSLRLKPSGTELVNASGNSFGLLRDQLWKPKYSFGDRFYSHRIERGDDQVSLELWATGVGGMMRFTEMRKRITLRKNGPVVQVHYTLTNEPSSQTDYEYGVWSHNWLGESGAVNSYSFPTEEGVRTFTLGGEQSKHGKETWYRKPARGWTAVTSDRGRGLAIEVPYKYLQLFYHWHGSGALTATHEWRFNILPIKAGEKLEWDYTLIPFEGLREVHGVVGNTVGRIDVTSENGVVAVTAQVLTPHGIPVGTARLMLLPAAGGAAVELDRADLTPGTTAALKGTSAKLPDGGYVARVEIHRGGKKVGDFERPVTVGAVRFAYRLEPECERLGKTEETASAKPGHEISTSVVTPHVPWARPFAGGRIKALVLMDDMNSREAVELAQRLDLELDYVKFRTTFATELLYQGDLSILTLEAAQKALLKRLQTREYDVIVLAGFKWDFHFTAEIRKLILDKVRAGTGLVLIQPDGFDAESARELPIAGVAKQGNAARNMHRWHTWQPGDHPLVNGLDWARFPPTRRHEYDTPPQGEVIATIGKDAAPLITLGSLGKGRVLSTTWDTLTHVMSYRGYSALTPILSYRGGWLRPEFEALPKGYHECWYALLTRLVAWAAARDTGVAIVAAPVVKGTVDRAEDLMVRLQVDSKRVVAGTMVETYWFNGIGQRHGPLKAMVDLVAGINEIVVPVPEPPVVTAGDNTVCFVLRDPGGGALAWGYTTVHLTAQARIKDIVLTPDQILPQGGVWQQGEAVETKGFTPSQPLGVTVRLAESATDPLDVRITLVDSLDRILAGDQATMQAGSSELTVTFPPQPLADQGVEVTVELASAGRVIDVRQQRAVAYRPRVWNRFWYTSWGGQYLWRTKYLFDYNNRLVRDFGVDVSFWGDTEIRTGKVRDNAFWGVNHSYLGLLSYLGRGVPNFMDKSLGLKMAEYAKTGDKAQLERTPCLVDPEWREAMRKKLVERVQPMMPAGGCYDYCMGDEMSLTSYTKFHDYDWSPASLADFRRWLKTRHASLDALNDAWNTAFATWDAVMPLTREEAREAANPAPWFEFRSYMNTQLADLYRFVVETIRDIDPHAQCGLSGTQSPEAGNGMDWWKQAFSFSYYHSYNTSWSNEMRRSFQYVGGAQQSPYFSGYSARNPGAENRMWWCLFHDTRGISAWKTGLFFHGDFSKTRSGVDTEGHLRSFRRGVWRLLRGAKRQHDGIAIYYSMPTIIAGALTGETKKINAGRDAWVKILEDCGLQYEFVSSEQVAAGFLRKDGQFKAVVLPYTLALSQVESEALRSFVKTGGALLATRPVGVRDAMGRLQKPSMLANVFGAKIDGPPQPMPQSATLEMAIAGLDAGVEIALPAAVTNLALIDGKALARAGKGKLPCLVTGPAGRTLLLNLDLTHYEQERRFHSPVEGQIRALVLNTLAGVGVRPPYPLQLASGNLPQVEMVRYRAAGMEFLCLLNAGNEPDVATISLGSRQHVYDVRAERRVTMADTLRVPLDPKCARVYCLTAQPVSPPTIEAAGSVSRMRTQGTQTHGTVIKFAVARTRRGNTRQLVRVTVVDAQGRERGEHMQTIWVENTPVSSSFPLALNDPLGDWKLTATDVISGRKASVTVTVTE